ncbi:MAG TPA: right-handed parallel beta-helix repeat-containing protein, partial [Pirellula sp.]|nr:right-handed parallel beta-helix repeat-containing protein [Pirellula sp.]
LSTGIRFVDSDDININGLILQDALAGQNTVANSVASNKEASLELVRCKRVSMTGCQILEGTPAGVLIEDCSNLVMTGCTVLDDRQPQLMKNAILWKSSKGSWKGLGNLVQGCRLSAGTVIPAGVVQGHNVIE